MSEADIIRYYETCEVDYRINWRLDASKSLHYGYWDAGTRTFAQALQNTHRELACLAGIRRGERVLDAGCGVGGGAIWLARHHRCHVVGISLVEGQVRQAIKNAQAAGVGALCGFDQRSYLATGWDDASFDAAQAIESSCYAADKADFFREIYRLLRPGGRLVVADFFRAQAHMRPRDEDLMARWERSWAIPAYAGFARFPEQAREAGFVDTTMTDVTSHVERSARRLYRRFWPGLAVSAWAYPLRIRDRVQTDHVWSALWQWQALRRGLWKYGFLVAHKPE